MKWTPFFLQIAMVCLLLAAAGCATPESRIKKNPELFNSLPPEVQQNVRQGKIDLGYSKDAVTLALGKPDREYTRRSAAGQKEVWSYTSSYTTTERQRVDADVRYRGSDGRLRRATDWIWVDVQQQHEYERLRLEFEQDIVSAIETLER